MPRYSGVRRAERHKLNAPVKYAVSGIEFSWTARAALGRAVQQLNKDVAMLDRRTNAAKNLRAAIKRLEKLRAAISQ
jgi:hypothetical protein